MLSWSDSAPGADLKDLCEATRPLDQRATFQQPLTIDIRIPPGVDGRDYGTARTDFVQMLFITSPVAINETTLFS